MEKENKEEKKSSKKCECGCDNKCCGWNGAGNGGVYGLGFIGALVYYLQHAANFQAGFFGLLKAIVWPAMVVYKAIEMWKI
jgi:hypothetical protein